MNQKIDNNVKIKRFDMAVNFYSILEIEGSPNLVCYDYNPIWNSWYPFYDDINKSPVEKLSNAKTYKELIEECDKILNINLNEKIQLAKIRFKELVGEADFELKELENFIIYEIKYSKTANLYTIYKLYNFVITSIDNKNILLNPKKLKSMTFNLENFNKNNLISNALFVAEHEDLKKFCL